MSVTSNRYDAEAIYLFDHKNAIKEMLYVEFEAVLDGVVGIPECRNQNFNAAYVSICSDLRIQAVVLFHIGFDAEGYVLKTWNLPLRYLASQATNGPDLGGGCIRVMSASDCDDPEYQGHLWNCGKNLVGVLSSIKESIKRNKLALYAQNPMIALPRSPWLGASAAEPSAAGSVGVPPVFFMPKDFLSQDYMTTSLEAVMLDQQQRVRNDLETSYSSLLKQLVEQNAELQEESETLNKQKRLMEVQARQQIDLIVDKYKSQLRAQLAEQELGWQTRLAEKELLLYYSEEKQSQLREEVAQLRQNIEIEKDQAVEGFLEKIATSDMALIVTKEGVGSFAIKPHQTLDYLDNQDAFLATRCGVSEAIYKAWSIHYQLPICQAGSSTGCCCAVPVMRIEDPRRFVMGESDMCSLHRFNQDRELY